MDCIIEQTTLTKCRLSKNKLDKTLSFVVDGVDNHYISSKNKYIHILNH